MIDSFDLCSSFYDRQMYNDLLDIIISVGFYLYATSVARIRINNECWTEFYELNFDALTKTMSAVDEVNILIESINE
jgi:hypothetical protein